MTRAVRPSPTPELAQSTRRPRRWAVAAGLLVLVLVLGSCSDAHTEEDKYRADTGTDPHVVRVYVNKTWAPTIESLTEEYSKTHRGISFVMVVQTTPASVKRVSEGGRPDLWFEASDVISPFLSPAAVAIPVMRDDFLLLVQPGNPDRVTDLSVFAADQEPTSALCQEATPCGATAFELIREAGYDPKPDYTVVSAESVLTALSKKVAGAAMLFRSQALSQLPNLTIVELPDPNAGAIEYQFLRMTANPTAADFATWVQQSPEAAALVEPLGLTPIGGPQ